MKFLNLIRYKELLLIALAQYLIKYGFLLPFVESHNVFITLDHFHFALLVCSSLCIAAGGYVINAIYSIELDTNIQSKKRIINKGISEKDGFTIFIVLNVIGVGLGYYLSNDVGKSGFFILFFIASALLYLYASALKQMAVIGNIVIALVLALGLMVIGIFELLPPMTANNQNIQLLFLNILRDYAIFMFLLGFVYALIKDIKVSNAAKTLGMQTLPIVSSKKTAITITFTFCLICTTLVLYYLVTYLYKQQMVLLYGLVLIVAPLLYVSIQLLNSKKELHNRLLLILKLVMFTSILSMTLYRFVI